MCYFAFSVPWAARAAEIHSVSVSKFCRSEVAGAFPSQVIESESPRGDVASHSPEFELLERRLARLLIRRQTPCHLRVLLRCVLPLLLLRRLSG